LAAAEIETRSGSGRRAACTAVALRIDARLDNDAQQRTDQQHRGRPRQRDRAVPVHRNAAERPAARYREIPERDDHRLRDIGALARGTRRGRLKERGGTTEREPPYPHPGIDNGRQIARQTERHDGRTEQRDTDQRQPAQMPVHQHADDRDTHKRHHPKHKQYDIHALLQICERKKRRDVGVENGMREHIGEHHREYGLETG
ncbi:hypothetical protein KCU90_g2408, partial [Aureobasidium melanogenum]